MLRPSKLMEKLEDLIEKKCGPWYERHKAKFPFYIPLGLVAWYFYGMLLSSFPKAGGVEPDLGETLRQGRRQPDLSGQRPAGRRPCLHMGAIYIGGAGA